MTYNQIKHMRHSILLIIALFVATTSSAQIKKEDREWLNHIRHAHPRMFITSEDIPQIKEAAKTFRSEAFDAMKKRTDVLFDKGIVFKNELAKTGESTRNHQYGHNAADAAMMWHITQDRRYLDLAKQIINKMTDYYHLRVSNNLNVEWYAFSQIAVLCAYDWVYNDLTIAERESMGQRLYDALYNVAVHNKNPHPQRFRENKGNHKSGLYGPRVLPWYIGLTFYGEGIDDEQCREMLCSGYDLHQKTFEWRSRLLAGNGGAGCGTTSYAFGSYPYAEYDFIYSFRSATGIDIRPQMKYMVGYLQYMDWIRLPENREFGAGDANHKTCKLPNSIGLHINELTQLFGEQHPEIIPWASGLLARYNLPTLSYSSASINFLPMLHRFDISKSATAKVASKQKSMHFKTLGQIYMRSGIDDNDTYAMFTTERLSNQHQHFDQNNFVIYKHGFRALDSGTRPQPGLHLSHYYARTVAHNCITIRMPNEIMPKYWGTPAKGENRNTPVPNDGGQRNSLAAKLLAYDEQSDYVYIASDATKCYHKDKAELVVREFVWCAPDLFIIFDRVVSDKAEYPKRWLYHTAAEPTVKRNEFVEVSQGGKSICRTLLPRKAVIEKIGGEGKQFWSDGQNWPIPSKRHSWVPNNNYPLVGQWRMEISPKKATTSDHFLHIIQVGDESLQALPKTSVTENKTSLILTFEYNSKSYSILFDKVSKYGCKIVVN